MEVFGDNRKISGIARFAEPILIRRCRRQTKMKTKSKIEFSALMVELRKPKIFYFIRASKQS